MMGKINLSIEIIRCINRKNPRNKLNTNKSFYYLRLMN